MTARQIIEVESPKGFLKVLRQQRALPAELVKTAITSVLETPYSDDGSFHVQAQSIVVALIKDLEAALGRRALDGLVGYMTALMPKPWYYERVTPRHTRMLLSVFRRNSKKVLSKI